MPWQKQKPLFIVFEGGEGSGKTTQTTLLFQRLKRLGRQVKYNDEPGSTSAGFKIRNILLGSQGELDPLSEFLLFESDRSLDYKQNIIPFLQGGFDIIQDRNFGSTFAYQGYGRGLIKTHEKIMKIVDETVRQKYYPDIIFLLDGNPAQLMRRIKKATSFEKEKIAFHNLVRKGFLSQARADRKHWIILDATKSQQTLHEKIWQTVSGLF
ncbi:MAG: dTMP kinase [Patescibacteria group bacterium]|nr:dTMP kinase [Patescibacteria group bacterium]MDE2014988.1 dTMP kinase [Patescibacteria group bacterium]MDE2226417.1 dTMP kinase [Patescibacteria group bacterium]